MSLEITLQKKNREAEADKKQRDKRDKERKEKKPD